MEHECRRRHPRKDRACVLDEVELEERGSHVRLGGAALVAAERLDLLSAGSWNEQPCKHLRGEHPVGPHEVDERVARGRRDVVTRGVAAEEDEPVHTLGKLARKARCREAGARGREDRGPPAAAGLEHRRELTCLGLGRRRGGERAVGHARPEPVVAHDAMAAGKVLEERPSAGLLPFLLEVRHPPAAEQEQRALAHRRVGDPPSVQLAETDVLLHHP